MRALRIPGGVFKSQKSLASHFLAIAVYIEWKAKLPCFMNVTAVLILVYIGGGLQKIPLKDYQVSISCRIVVCPLGVELRRHPCL